jgi:hypothetical protein
VQLFGLPIGKQTYLMVAGSRLRRRLLMHCDLAVCDTFIVCSIVPSSFNLQLQFWHLARPAVWLRVSVMGNTSIDMPPWLLGMPWCGSCSGSGHSLSIAYQLRKPRGAPVANCWKHYELSTLWLPHICGVY